MAIRILCVLCVVFLTFSPAGQAADDSTPVAIHQFLTRLESLGFAGVVGIAQNGMPVLVEGYGLANRETEDPWNPATVSTIGSITKQFTGSAILRLQEQGKLSVEDSITRYFDNVSEDKRSITLHQLLTHSSGIVDLQGIGDFDPIARDEFIRRALEQDLAFAPGEEYDYSNAGYSLLGAIIEQITDGAYETFLRRELLIPLGLYETGYQQPLWGTGRLAHGYTEEGPWGTVLERPFAEDGPYWVLRANGGLHSTVYDMLRWGQALLAGRVLTAPSMKEYWAPHVDEGGGTYYAYGWVVDEITDQKVITHNGGNGIFFADMALVPDADLVIFLQTNVRSPLPMVEGLLYPILETWLTGEPLPRIPARLAVDDSLLSPLAGTYKLMAGGELSVAVDEGALVVAPQDPGAFAWLLSTREVDLERTRRLSDRINAIVTAYLKGGFKPLWEAYDRRVTLEFLSQTMEGRMQGLVDENGPFQRHEILGTALRTEREITLVRLHFENGFADRAYVWSQDQQAKLLGVSRRGLEPSMLFLPEGERSFASWDPRTGESRPLSIEENEEGHLRLRLGEGDLVTEAVKR